MVTIVFSHTTENPDFRSTSFCTNQSGRDSGI